MNRRHFLSLLGLAPVGAVAVEAGYPKVGGIVDFNHNPTLVVLNTTDGRLLKWTGKRWIDLPRTGETRQVFTTHNVGQPNAYQTEHQIVFDGTEWVASDTPPASIDARSR